MIYLGFTGVDAPYQSPIHPDVVIDTSVISVDRSLEIILAKLAASVSLFRFM
jgi:adenylylsulfate kinase-like enzyme